jgi:hypothetical protein
VCHVNEECRRNINLYAHIVPETAPFHGTTDLLGAAEAAWSLKGLARSWKSGVSFSAMNFLAIIICGPDVGHIPFLANGYRG